MAFDATVHNAVCALSATNFHSAVDAAASGNVGVLKGICKRCVDRYGHFIASGAASNGRVNVLQ
jgi:hypothetical protein